MNEFYVVVVIPVALIFIAVLIDYETDKILAAINESKEQK